MALLDLLGRRWVLRLLWELRHDNLGFRELQLRCDRMSPSVLNQRLRELTGAGVMQATEGRYRLTAEGRELLEMLGPLHDWARRWARRAPRSP
jgi:DNA-binding HxlR family transcriptional regulator